MGPGSKPQQATTKHEPPAYILGSFIFVHHLKTNTKQYLRPKWHYSGIAAIFNLISDIIVYLDISEFI